MRKSQQAAEAAPSPFSSIDPAPALYSLFGCNPETALAAVNQFKGQRHHHTVGVRTPDPGPARHRADMYRTFRANGETSVPTYVAEHFARVGSKPPQPEILQDPEPVEDAEQEPHLITDQWLHTFVKWHIEMEGICPHENSTSPVYFKIGDKSWSKVETSWLAINAQRLALGQSGLNEFVTLHGYEESPVRGPSLSPAPNPISDHWLKTFAIWHFEKKGAYPSSQATTPVYFKLQQPGQPDEWVETGLHWADLNDSRILAGQLSLDEFMEGISGQPPSSQISSSAQIKEVSSKPAAKPRVARPVKTEFSTAQVQSVTSPAVPPALTSVKTGAVPELNTLYLDYLLDKFRTKTKRDPDCTQERDRVWDIDAAGRWVELPLSWNEINQALTHRTHGVESAALTLKGHIRRQLPEITPAYLKSLLDLHQQQEKRSLKTDDDSLNQNVWMKTSDGALYKSMIRWNLFAEHLKTPEAAARFGTQDFGAFVRRQTLPASGSPDTRQALRIG